MMQYSPQAQVCQNCRFYRVDRGVWCVNGWSGDGSHGFCHAFPKRSDTTPGDTCMYFERGQPQ